MSAVLGVKKLISQLRDKAAKVKKDSHGVSVVVGYTANYAIWVHENRNAYHKVGRAGFLLDVFREIIREIATTVSTALQQGKTMAQALLAGGLLLQRMSQKNVPVLTGNLKNSAFTRLEK